ncbi:PREDICTED: nucleoside diphosphate-linked moiety X motif 22 isoform X2 [Ceratotherium simum simum]|uniref:Nucleoside diphosphate-linked moiety X motif 22 isoform X2 n=1 Tax=Ceratotherium simum simum TaxID=73337 RepID=A0ABM1D9G7_CERSS|nr:PREDICTED: nucleoside diphosphate-linked moiety X motif 22 isoform X2 [Ceratotherium simum simum]
MTVGHCQEGTRPSLPPGRAGYRPSPGSLTPPSSACIPPPWRPLALRGHSCSCAWALLPTETSWAPTGPAQLPGCDSRGPPTGVTSKPTWRTRWGWALHWPPLTTSLSSCAALSGWPRHLGWWMCPVGTLSLSPLHTDLPGELVVHELFSSVLQEICDEVNLPLLTLSQPLLLGIACNETSAGRASAEFYVQCSLTSEQVREHYTSGGPEAHESTGIIFVETQSVRRLQETEMWAELCPSAKGAIFLYNRVQGSPT